MDLSKKVFVTVGTTKFDKLIEKVSSDEILELLVSLGFNSVQFQTGTGNVKPRTHPKIRLKYDPYFENFLEQIEAADLIIGHGGAGTCLEVLQKGKPLIVVVNEELMNNHQTELAKELSKEGYALYSNLANFEEVLKQCQVVNLKLYPKPKPDLFSEFLNKSMGF